MKAPWRLVSKALACGLVLALLPACGWTGFEFTGPAPTPSPPPAPRPSAPGGVKTYPQDGRIRITWNPVSSAINYYAYMALESGLTPANYTSLSGGKRVHVSTTEATFTNLVNGTTCYFIVTANNTGGQSPPSSEISAVPMPVAPSAPTGVAVATGSGRLVVSWDPVPSAESYNVYYAAASGVTRLTYAGLPGGTRAAGATSPEELSGLENEILYYLVVTAVNITAESAESAEVSAMPTATATFPETGEAWNILDTSATAGGTFTNPETAVTSVWFEYGTTPAYGQVTTPEAHLAAGPVSVSQLLEGLSGGTDYHYRLATSNSGGTYYGVDRTFRTPYSPEILASDLDAPVMTANDTHVYWLEIYGDTVKRMRHDGTEQMLVSTSDVGGNSGWIRLGATHVYWADNMRIWKAPLDGGPAVLVVDRTGTSSFFRDLAVVDSAVSSQGIWWNDNGAVYRSALDGANALAAGLVDVLHMVLDDDYVYTLHAGGRISRTPAAGGSTVTLVAVGEGSRILLDQGTLYWVGADGIRSVPAAGGTVSLVVPVRLGSSDLAKEGNVFWGWETAGSLTHLTRVDAVSGTTSVLVAAQRYPRNVTVRGLYVYWVNDGNHYYPPMGSVRRAPKDG